FRQGYSARADLGGGVILTFVHELDAAFWCFGPVAEVYARAGALSDLDLPVEDVAQMLLTFETGVLAHVAMDYVQWPPVRTVSVVGTEGRLLWDANGAGVELYRRATETRETFPHPDGFERNDTFLDELRHFLACLEGTETPLIPLAEGKAVLEIALAAKEAAATGQPVRLGEGPWARS
ncbi:MAG: Gfo/Idh/MocA family oxidoreductase, partial [Nitrospinota bacterium]